MEFRASVTYPADRPKTTRMLADRSFYYARFADSPAKVESVDVESSASEVRITTTVLGKAADLDLPSFAQRFIPASGARLSVVETWNTTNNTGTLSLKANGLPISLSGECVLIDEGATVRRDMKGTLAISVPLVGRRLESAMVEEIPKAVAEEERVARNYLADK